MYLLSQAHAVEMPLKSQKDYQLKKTTSTKLVSEGIHQTDQVLLHFTVQPHCYMTASSLEQKTAGCSCQIKIRYHTSSRRTEQTSMQSKEEETKCTDML